MKSLEELVENFCSPSIGICMIICLVSGGGSQTTTSCINMTMECSEPEMVFVWLLQLHVSRTEHAHRRSIVNTH